VYPPLQAFRGVPWDGGWDTGVGSAGGSAEPNSKIFF